MVWREYICRGFLKMEGGSNLCFEGDTFVIWRRGVQNFVLKGVLVECNERGAFQ